MSSDVHPGRAAARRLVRQTRTYQGLSREALAESAGIAAKSVYNFENGPRWPHDYNLRALERALGMRLGVLDEVVESEHPDTITVADLQEHPEDVPTETGLLLSDATEAEILMELASRVAQLRAERDAAVTERDELRDLNRVRVAAGTPRS